MPTPPPRPRLANSILLASILALRVFSYSEGPFFFLVVPPIVESCSFSVVLGAAERARESQVFLSVEWSVVLGAADKARESQVFLSVEWLIITITRI
jgi:hypothetical protein